MRRKMEAIVTELVSDGEVLVEVIEANSSKPVKLTLDAFIKLVSTAGCNRVLYYSGKLIYLIGTPFTLNSNPPKVCIMYYTIYTEVEEYRKYVVFDLQKGRGEYTDSIDGVSGSSQVLLVVPVNDEFPEIKAFLKAMK